MLVTTGAITHAGEPWHAAAPVLPSDDAWPILGLDAYALLPGYAFAQTTTPNSGAFITTWKTESANQRITINFVGTGMNIDWGDNNTDTNVSGSQTHTYATVGTYTVSVTGGLTGLTLEIPLDDEGDPTTVSELVSIDQWGNTSWTNMNSAFAGASNMVYRATDMPDMSRVTDMSNMFDEAHSFNGNLSSWDVSKVTDMSDMFYGAHSFNGDLSSWDVSQVTDMSTMFSGANAFNGDLSSWDVSKVTDMNLMFATANAFNGDLSSWDVSKVTDMSLMFDSAIAFNGDISSWDVSKVTDMSRMFARANSFEQNLGKWYIVPADTAFTRGAASLDVTTISAQNAVLRNQTPTYLIEDGVDSALFSMTADTLAFKIAPPVGSYKVNVTASGSNVFENRNNWRVLDVMVTERDNILPTVNVGKDRTVSEDEPVSLSWKASDDDGDSLTYTWSQSPTDPPITFASQGSSPTTFTAPSVNSDTRFTLTLTANDGIGDVTDSLTILVKNNRPPVVEAGTDKTVNERAKVTLSGSASDPDRDPLEYSWSQNSGPAVTLTNDNTARPQFTAPGVTSDATIVFIFTATDGRDSAEDMVTVTVRDVPITVSSATYRSGTIKVTFNQDINGAPDYSRIHVRSTGSDAGSISLSDVDTKSYSGRTITATLSSEQQKQYDTLQGPQLDIGQGAVTDLDNVGIDEMPNMSIRTAGSGKKSPAPAIGLDALASRGVDIPEHIANMTAGRGSGPIPPVTPDDTFDFPLVIDGNGYLLEGLFNTLVPHTATAGQEVEITFTVHGQNDLAHFALYLNMHGQDVNYSRSDTYVLYDGSSVQVSDPHDYIPQATITVSQDKDKPGKHTVTVTMLFGEPMGLTNMMAYLWDTNARALQLRMFDALDVQPEAAPVTVDLEPDTPDDSAGQTELPDAEPLDAEPLDAEPLEAAPVGDEITLLSIRMWSGFESESITDSQLLVSLELDYPGADIPEWVMTELGVLVAKGEVTVDEFRTALEYVLETQ